MDVTFAHKQTGTIATVSIRGSEVLFGTVVNGLPKYTYMEGLDLNVANILKEFPDLKGKSTKQIKIIAIKRFKKKLFGFKTDLERIDYLKKDLGKIGYKGILYKLPGKDPVKIED